MSSDKFIKIAKHLVKEDKATFDTLMEFEETKKIRTKLRMNFTIDKAIAEKFKKISREKGFNMSAKIEKAMEELINQ